MSIDAGIAPRGGGTGSGELLSTASIELLRGAGAGNMLDFDFPPLARLALEERFLRFGNSFNTTCVRGICCENMK